MRTPEICKTAVCLLLVAIASPAMAGPAAADDAASATLIFRQLNDAAIAIYRDTKQRFLGKADPVVIAGFSSVLIRRHGAEQRVGEIPAAYALLKTIDHVPRSLWAAVDPAVEGLDPEAAWRKQLTDFRPRVAAALNAIPGAGVPEEAAGRGERTLRTCLGLIDALLALGVTIQGILMLDMR
jgi:hypothetical protein